MYFGEAFVDDDEAPELTEKLYDATRQCAALDWHVHDLVLVPVPSLDEPDAL
ncbi:MAG TPA: hypothetical protein VML55_02300 [Planctomycetaceae bacterium]|nr:hypothetical protein [Planctomycetaceae bacterium]